MISQNNFHAIYQKSRPFYSDYQATTPLYPWVPDSMIKRVPGNLSLSLSGVTADNMIARLKDLEMSSRAAYSTDSKSSHLLKALGVSDDLSAATIRIEFGGIQSEKEMDFTAEPIADDVYRQQSNP